MGNETEEFAINLIEEQSQIVQLLDFIGCVNQERFRGCPAGTILIIATNGIPAQKRLTDHPDCRRSEIEIVFEYNPEGHPVELPRRVFAENAILQQVDFPA